MGKRQFLFAALSGVFVFLFIFSIKAEASGFFPFANQKNEDYFQKQLQKICTAHKPHWLFWRLPTPKICRTKNKKPPTLEFYAEPTSITAGDKATLSWASDNTFSCEASGGWHGEKTLSGEKEIRPKKTKTYTLTCDGVWDSVEKSVTVEVHSAPIEPNEPTDICPNIPDIQETIPAGDVLIGGQCVAIAQCESPQVLDSAANTCVDNTSPPTIDHIIISEVYYNPASPYGSGTANEWFELYNGTSNSVDLTGWTIWDTANSSHDTFSSGATIAANGFLFITASSSTLTLWTLPANTATFVLPNTIGSNGLGNSGDALIIKNSAGDVVDAISYGSDTTILNPSITNVAAGHSIHRINLTSDTNTTADWEDVASSTLGNH